MALSREDKSGANKSKLGSAGPELSPTVSGSPLIGGSGLTGISGRKTANASDRSPMEIIAVTTAHLIFVGRNVFTDVCSVVVQ